MAKPLVKEAVMPKAVELVNRADKTVGSTMSRLGALLSGKKDPKKEEDAKKAGMVPPAPAPVVPPPPGSPIPPTPAPLPPTPVGVPPAPGAVPPVKAPLSKPVPIPPAAPTIVAPTTPPKVSGVTPAVPLPAVPKSVEELKGIPSPKKPTVTPVQWQKSNITLLPEVEREIKRHTATNKYGVIINFRKVDDTLRRIYCTTNMSIIPPSERPKGLKKPREGIMAVYDLEKNDWRSFVLQRVINMAPVVGKSSDGKPILGEFEFFNGKGPEDLS